MVRIVVLCVASVAAHDFDAYMNKFGKAYNGEDEYAKRKAIYESNMDFIEAENSKNHSYTLGETQFTDLTNEEFSSLYVGGYKALEGFVGDLPHLGEHEVVGDVAASVNWVTNGAVTPVKNQGQCGSCWSFSTTGRLEGAWQIGSGSLTAISEQQFVDCDKLVNRGCKGGSMGLAFTWARSQNLCTEASYPYTAKDGSCQQSCSTAIPKGHVTGYKSVGNFLIPATKEKLQSAIQQQPVSIAIKAGGDHSDAFQHYTSGILTQCGSQLDHGVLAAGYDSDAGYWLVKNSWGTGWGENGYVRISDSSNFCGVLSSPAYPTVSASVSV